MNIDQLLTQSLQLLGLGMGSVFVILILLIGIISLISKIVPEEVPVQQPLPQATPAPISENNEHISAIQAAIHQFRKKR